MAEPKDGQADKTPPAAKPETPKAPGTGDGNTPQGSGLTLDAVQKYLADHPEEVGNLKIGGVKVDGAEAEIALSQLTTDYQTRTSSMKRFEEAARIKREAEEKLAELEKRGDPLDVLLDRLNATKKPTGEPDPLERLSSEDLISTPEVTRAIILREREQAAKRESELTNRLNELEKKVQEGDEQARKSFDEYRTRLEMEKDFNSTHASCPEFTATLYTDKEGNAKINLGKNPYLTGEVLRLANSDIPDERLGGRAGKGLPLSEIANAISADLDKQAELRAQRKREATEREREKSATTIAATGEIPSLPVEIASMPEGTKEERKAKAAKIREHIRNSIPESVLNQPL